MRSTRYMGVQVKTSYPKLRSVKYKGGGEVRLLPPPTHPIHDEIIKFSQRVADVIREDWNDLHGFLVVYWDRTGDYRAGWRYSYLDEGNPIPATLVPSFVHDILLRERIDKNIEMMTGFRPDQGDP